MSVNGPISPTIVVANPAAGGGRLGKGWAELESRIAMSLGAHVPMRLTEEPGQASDIVHQAVDEGFRTIISVGGDGTHHEILNGMMTANVPSQELRLGILHAGTGGDFRRVLHADGVLDDNLKTLPRATSELVDVGAIRFIRDDGEREERYFLNMASAGLAGHVDRIVNRSSKRFGGRATFFLATIQARASYGEAEVSIELDGTPLGSRPITNVMVANGPYAGGGMKLAPDARLADGLLEVVIVRASSFIRSLKLVPKLYNGQHVHDPLVEVYRGRQVQLSTAEDEPVLLDIDGESPGKLPAQFKVMPKAIRLLNVKPTFL